MYIYTYIYIYTYTCNYIYESSIATARSIFPQAHAMTVSLALLRSDKLGQTALHLACERGHGAVVRAAQMGKCADFPVVEH